MDLDNGSEGTKDPRQRVAGTIKGPPIESGPQQQHTLYMQSRRTRQITTHPIRLLNRKRNTSMQVTTGIR